MKGFKNLFYLMLRFNNLGILYENVEVFLEEEGFEPSV
jgi:hypothetical protein